ncbi:MAG: hypothetical protein KatS3mg068_1724 [Candidatus Sericytochromatia bacterium]|nr:MAG: hypothetical protein KatS3mg068_1724 [Candidatus Sericytochromatia bacterium]
MEKNYLAYGDSLNLKELSKKQIATITYNNRQATLVAYENEMNSVREGIIQGAINGLKKTRDAILGAVSNTVTSVGPTSVVLAGGAMGIAAYAMMRSAGNATTATTIGASSTLGNVLKDILKNGSIGALKVITVAGAIGFGITAAAGAIGGVSEALGTEKDLSTIASVTKDGNENFGIIGTPPTNTSPVNNTPVNNTPNQTPTTNDGQITPSPILGPRIFSRPEMNNQFNYVSGYLSSRN